MSDVALFTGGLCQQLFSAVKPEILKIYPTNCFIKSQRITYSAMSTCNRVTAAEGIWTNGLAGANAIVSLWTDWRHNRCVNMTGIQPIHYVWLI